MPLNTRRCAIPLKFRVFSLHLKLNVHTRSIDGESLLASLLAFILPRFLNSTFLWSFLCGVAFILLRQLPWTVDPVHSWQGSAVSSQTTEAGTY